MVIVMPEYMPATHHCTSSSLHRIVLVDYGGSILLVLGTAYRLLRHYSPLRRYSLL